MIEIVDTGPLNTIQDLGRLGYRDIGVTVSGAMDPLALRIANLLVGNDAAAAAVELQTFPVRIRFQEKTAFAVTGGGTATLDGETRPPWWMQTADAGQILDVGPSKTSARAYLAIGGGIDVAPVMGSRSTSLRGAFGGNDGRALRKGDVLRLGSPAAGLRPAGGFGVVPPLRELASLFPVADNGALLIRALPAG
ncbi:MAG: allophanate hydrolase, partial [Pararhizobium sp.]